MALSLPDALFHPRSRNETAFQRAYDTELDPWEFMLLPENTYLRSEANANMEAIQSLCIPDGIIEGMVIPSDNPKWRIDCG
jgi:hypothetical protein